MHLTNRPRIRNWLLRKFYSLTILSLLGWIPESEIEMFFFLRELLIFQKNVTDSLNHAAWFRGYKIFLSDFLGIFNFYDFFLKMHSWRWYSWANHSRNLRKCIELDFQPVELIKLTGLFDFSSTHAISTPVKSNFCVVFDIEVFRVESRECHRHQKMWNFLRIFLSI